MAVGTIRRKKLARFGGTKGMPELEEKAVRRVKTQAGVDRFKQPMGSIIIGGGAGNVLKNLKVSDSDYDGFDVVESTGSRNKGTFYVGKYEGDSTFSVTDANDEILHEAPSQEAAFKWLNTHANGSDTPAEKPKPGSGKSKMSEAEAIKTPEYDRLYNAFLRRVGELRKNHGSGAGTWKQKLASDGGLQAIFEQMEDMGVTIPTSGGHRQPPLSMHDSDSDSGGGASKPSAPAKKGPRGTASQAYSDAYEQYIKRASDIDGEAARGGKTYTARMAADPKIKELRAIMDEELAAGGRKVPTGRSAYPAPTAKPAGGSSGSPKLGGGKLGGRPIGGTRGKTPFERREEGRKKRTGRPATEQIDDANRKVPNGGKFKSERDFMEAVAKKKDLKNISQQETAFKKLPDKRVQAAVLKRLMSVLNQGVRIRDPQVTGEDREDLTRLIDSLLDIYDGKKADNIMESLAYKAVPISGVSEVDGDEPGVVTAIVSVTGIKDNVNDIILPGAFIKSLAARNPKGVWHHNITESVSRTEAVEELAPGHKSLPDTLPNGQPWPSEAGGLLVKTRFNLNTTRGRDAYEDVKFFGSDQEWSIGYNVPMGGATIDKKTGTRMIHHLDLFEYSPVLFGAMPNARTVSVKSAQAGWKAIDNPAMSMEIKDLLSQLADEQNALHIKSAEKDSEDDDDDDEEMTDKNGKPLPDFIARKIKKGRKGEKSEHLGEDDDEDEDTDPVDDEDDDDEDSEEKSFNVALDSKSVGYIEAAIESLTALRDHVVGQHKSSVVDDDDDDEDNDDDDTESKGDSALAGLLSDAGLDGDADGFDKAIADKDSDAAEEIGSAILDAVESATDKGDDKTALKAITAYIAKAFQKIDAEEPAEDEADKPTEKKDDYIQLDQKSYAEFQSLLTD